ncbi:MAG TPA: hypothetical protein RMH80_18390, partial [Polyangiaceae bacterium LLY-WYZ-15_(1-7)]|nr:hypothetical protein [Polyangiaceae bacterium LLY-WYZ-15_(1-7)]
LARLRAGGLAPGDGGAGLRHLEGVCLRGEGWACWLAGVGLDRRGERERAEAAYAQACERGHATACAHLAERREDERDALRARACELGLQRACDDEDDDE